MVFYSDLYGVLKTSKLTVNRSPFVSKKSRDQFESRTYHNKIKSFSNGLPLDSALCYACALDCSNQTTVSSYELHNYITIIYG